MTAGSCATDSMALDRTLVAISQSIAGGYLAEVGRADHSYIRIKLCSLTPATIRSAGP